MTGLRKSKILSLFPVPCSLFPTFLVTHHQKAGPDFPPLCQFWDSLSEAGNGQDARSTHRVKQ
ncbi:MAG: hypothetical protein F6K65_34740 [Moorea sp. SIO3C2]|nr:hypothetical protein [Moorena sp. SIO3C2]